MVKRPSAWLYVIGLAVIVIMSVVAIVLFVTGILGSAPDTRFVVPGEQELEFKDTGEYSLFYEYQSTVDGVTYSTAEHLTGMVVTLHSLDGSLEVPLEDASVSTTYTIGSRSGVLLANFSIDESGTYVLTAQYQDGRTAPDVVLAVGRFSFVKMLLPGILLGFVGFVAGVLLLVWVLVKRRKAGARV